MPFKFHSCRGKQTQADISTTHKPMYKNKQARTKKVIYEQTHTRTYTHTHTNIHMRKNTYAHNCAQTHLLILYYESIDLSEVKKIWHASYFNF